MLKRSRRHGKDMEELYKKDLHEQDYGDGVLSKPEPVNHSRTGV